MSSFDIKLQGTVLNSMPIGENDRRVVILTREKGKISAFARGARRPRSPLVAATNPFSTGVFYVYPGRDSYSLHSADIKNYFSDLTGDIERVWYGYLLLEIAEYFALENADERERLVLLYQALRALGSEDFDPELVRLVYLAKTIWLEGIYPDVFSCRFCGRSEPLTGFSFVEKGAVCKYCAEKNAGISLVSKSGIYTLQHIAATPSKKLFNFSLADEVLQELCYIVNRYFRESIDHEFKSEEFLDL